VLRAALPREFPGANWGFASANRSTSKATVAPTSRPVPASSCSKVPSRTGVLIRGWDGAFADGLFGHWILSPFAPGTENPARTLPGDVRLYSSVTGSEHGRWSGRQPGELFGRMLVAVGDLDHDDADCWFGWHIRCAPDPEGRGRPAVLISSLRHQVDGKPGIGVVDLYVLESKNRPNE
jgi:hypothetical protein